VTLDGYWGIGIVTAGAAALDPDLRLNGA